MYDEWGQLKGGSDNVGLNGRDRARFKGALWFGDAEVELYYMRNRWYEPKTGRFLSEDPVGLNGGLNRYAFAADDPVNRFDPAGLRACQGRDDSHPHEDDRGWTIRVEWHDCTWFDENVGGGLVVEDGEDGYPMSGGTGSRARFGGAVCAGAVAGAVATSAADAALVLLAFEAALVRRGASTAFATAERAGLSRGATAWARQQLARIGREAHRIYRGRRTAASQALDRVALSYFATPLLFVGAQLSDANVQIPNLFFPFRATDQAWDEAAARCAG